jgi:hypothetical protein
MRIWVGVLAVAITAMAVGTTFFPEAFDSNELGALRAAVGTRERLLSLALFTYAVVLWAVALRLVIKRLRVVVLPVLLSGLLGWVWIVFLALREGATVYIVGPLVMTLLIFGVPSVLAVLLVTSFRNGPKPIGVRDQGAT